MKKVIYAVCLAALWVIVILLLGILLVFFGLTPTDPSFMYSLGTACGHPQLWVIAAGFVLLLRPVAWKLITKESKPFRKSAAITILILGIVWLSMNVGARLLNEYTSKRLMEQYDPDLGINASSQNSGQANTSVAENEYTSKRLMEQYDPDLGINASSQNSGQTNMSVAEIKKEIENKYIELCQRLNKQLPMRIDEITTLISISFVNWTMDYYYQVDINLEEEETDDWKQIIKAMRENGKSLTYELLVGSYNFNQDELYEFLKVTGMKLRFAYHDINGQLIGAYQYDYKDFERE